MAVRVEAQLRDERIRQYFAGLEKRYHQIEKKDRQVIGLMSAIVFRDVLDHFAKEQGPDGHWPMLSGPYSVKKAKKSGWGAPMLVVNGRLRMAFQPTNYRMTSDSVVWFNNAKTKTGFNYAAAHNTGGPQLPRREFMWLSDNGMDDIESSILKFLEGK